MIQMNDFRREPEELIQTQLQASERVIRSGWYVLGNEVKAFESSWANRCGLGHCIGVGNGMDAIEIGLRALGIGQGDEVITTSMTAFATVLAVLRAGAIPVLADIDPGTGLLDMASAQRCLSPRTKALLLVHLYGQVRDMDRWVGFCKDAGIALAEDCAQSHLAAWKGRKGGGFGEFGAYSFYPTKNLGTLGDGGAIVTSRADVAETSARLRNYGQSRRYHHPEKGLNSRLDEIHAALLTARLAWLEGFNERRMSIAAAYRANLKEGTFRLLAPPIEESNHVYHLFVVLSERREGLMAHLEKHGIESQIHYPVPIHHQEPCRGLARDPKGLSCTESHARLCLSIPCHPHMTDEEVARVIQAMNSF